MEAIVDAMVHVRITKELIKTLRFDKSVYAIHYTVSLFHFDYFETVVVVIINAIFNECFVIFARLTNCFMCFCRDFRLSTLSCFSAKTFDVRLHLTGAAHCFSHNTFKILKWIDVNVYKNDKSYATYGQMAQIKRNDGVSFLNNKSFVGRMGH